MIGARAVMQRREILQMELTLQLPDEIAMELRREAERRGVEPGKYATELICEHLTASERAKAIRSLFATWEAEDRTDDPEELARRREEWESLKRALDENRGSGRKLFGAGC